MEYTSLTCNITPIEPGAEIMMAQLAEIDFESFQNTETGLIAYIQSHLFDYEKLSLLPILKDNHFTVTYKKETIADQNWNAKWEENYEAVVIENRVAIRAPFHTPFAHLDFDIIIEPKMSFGTAHHGTTAQMIKLLLQNEVLGLRILDMGCGTGVLAILAALRGASVIDAIDIDEWAYNNSIENVAMNGVPQIRVELGDAQLLNGRKYDLIIANINRNILLNDLHNYSNCLESGKMLFMSGFYEEDLDILNSEAIKHNLFYQYHTVDRGWVAGVWLKK